jgi:hypothetical protein
MTRARTQTLMLAAAVVTVIAAAGEQLRARLHSPDRQRGTSSLEWAIIAAIVVGLATLVGAKVIAAVNSHAAQIK